MKATLTFNLPEEREEFNTAINGVNYMIALEDIRNKIRSWKKYEDKETVTIEELQDLWQEATADLNL